MSPSSTSEASGSTHGREKLYLGEQWWASRWSWLIESGYTLRPRYHPDWKPSWNVKKKDARKYEDGQLPNVRSFNSNIMDATARDGTFVTLKRVDRTRHPHEIDISVLLSSPEFSSDPRNHSVRVLDVLYEVPEEPDSAILVTPLLSRIEEPVMDTIGEFIAFYAQILEGLQFLHEHRIAHCDFFATNILMDAGPMYPAPFHPCDPTRRRDWKGKARHYTRTEKPVKYYIIDYGLSHKLEHDQSPFVLPIVGADKSVPEHQGEREAEPSDPFATDIYTAGNLVNVWFIERAGGEYDFMRPLLSSMTQEDPSKRPKIEEVVQRFGELRASLSKKTLRSRIVDKRTIYPSFSGLRFRLRSLKLALTGTPPIPDPRA
ncbi:hypothetical protein PENSPDRAFT_621715 [Peniophora sp. CONT]|nr:hypothetical protein PENSPDRAFT_621715 [Peniophora sp. CONT]